MGYQPSPIDSCLPDRQQVVNGSAYDETIDTEAGNLSGLAEVKSLAWRDLTVRVKDATTNETKLLIDSVDGFVKAGKSGHY